MYMFKIKNLLDTLGVVLVTLLTYFSEMKFSLHIMWVTMVFDLAVGLWKAKRVDKLRFSAKKFKYWLEYVAISTGVVLLIYATEHEMIWGDSGFYKGFMLLIIGFTLNSIIRNGESITGKFIFTALLDYVNSKVLILTGVDLKKYNKTGGKKNTGL